MPLVKETIGASASISGGTSDTQLSTGNFSNTVAVGDVVVVFASGVIGATASTGTVTAVTDSLGNAYTERGSATQVTGNRHLHVWSTVVTAAGTCAVTATFAQNSNEAYNQAIRAAHLDGTLLNPSPYNGDGFGSTGTIAGDGTTSFGATSPPADSIHLGAISVQQITVGSGFTSGGVAGQTTAEYKESASATTFTWTGGVAGTAWAGVGLSFVKVATPTVTSCNPSSGSTVGLETVVITGTSFAAGATVTFGGTAATSVVVDSFTQITCTNPAHAAGLVSVQVTNTNGQSGSANAFTYSLPVVTSLSVVESAMNGGVATTVTGQYFVTGATVKFVVGAEFALATGVTVVNSTTITCTVPANPQSLPHGSSDVAADCTVTNTDLGAGTLGSAFTYRAPTISNSPFHAPSVGGTTITVNGNWFYTGIVAKIGGTSAGGTFVSLTQMTFVSPAGSGSATFRVENVDGSFAQPGGNAFTWHAPGTPTANPTQGGVSGGLTITLSGLWYAPGITVTFGGVTFTVTTITVNDPAAQQSAVGDVGGVITGTNPAWQASMGAFAGGTCTVPVVITSGPEQNALGTWNYKAPVITSITPTDGPLAAGTSVDISGSFFPSSGEVFFGATSAGAFVPTTESLIENILSPLGNPGTVDIRVVAAGGAFEDTLENAFTYHAPEPASATPSDGPIAGSTAVTITGNYFTGSTRVEFGTRIATSFVVASTTQITCSTISHDPGLVDIVVFAPGASGTFSGTLASAFTYHAPEPASVTPSRGPAAGGTAVTIAGNYFTGAIRAEFGGSIATDFTVVGPTAITCTTPGHDYGQVDVVIFAPGQSWVFSGTLTNGFFYMARGWWYSTNDFTATTDVTSVDPSANENPDVPRDWTELAFATGNADYLGGFPGCAVSHNNKLVYAFGGYTVSTDAPSIRYSDGVGDRELCKIPPASGTVSRAVLSMLAANNTIYFSTYDAGTNSTDLAGRVFQLDTRTGALTLLGDNVFTAGYLPYALAWYQSKLWAGTNRVTASALGRVYWIRPGIDTAWTLDHTFTGNQGSTCSMMAFQDDLYIGNMCSSAAAAILFKRNGVDGAYSTSDTMPAATPANNNSFPAIAVFNNGLYASAFNPADATYIRRLSGTWSTAYSATGAASVPFIGLPVENGKLFAIGAKALSTATKLLRTANGTSYTDITASLGASPAPMGPAWAGIAV